MKDKHLHTKFYCFLENRVQRNTEPTLDDKLVTNQSEENDEIDKNEEEENEEGNDEFEKLIIEYLQLKKNRLNDDKNRKTTKQYQHV